MDGMQLPYATRCFRAHVLERPAGRADGQPADGVDAPDGPDDDVLLIDFR
jgi:hypothetical protein